VRTAASRLNRRASGAASVAQGASPARCHADDAERSSKAIAGFRWALSTLGCAVPSAVDALIGASGHWCPWGLWMLEDACGASGLLVGRLL
jgi:hypothetical protein